MNILIIGLGSIAKKHILALKQLNIITKIYALRSKPNSEDLEGVISIYDLNKIDLFFDFAIISNPTNLHFKYIELLAEKGVNLFIEKPPISSLENIEILERMIQESEIMTYVACNLRFHPCIQYIKEHLISNTKRINEINIYCGSYLPNWRPNKNFRDIYSVKPEMGGGVHLDLFHELDYTTWLFGFPLKSNYVLRNVSSLKIDAIDYANYLLEYESFSVNIILNYYRKDAKRSIEIIFEDETWTIDLIRNNIKNQNEFIIYENSDFAIEKTYYLQMQYFIEHSINKRKPMNCLKESLDVLKICLGNG